MNFKQLLTANAAESLAQVHQVHATVLLTLVVTLEHLALVAPVVQRLVSSAGRATQAQLIGGQAISCRHNNKYNKRQVHYVAVYICTVPSHPAVTVRCMYPYLLERTTAWVTA